ncbi:unnamed protein product, partial [Cladocopium goreaui]
MIHSSIKSTAFVISTISPPFAFLISGYLSSEISSRRQFSYLRYGSHMGLGQICSESPELWTGAFQRSKTFRIFRAWSILRRLIAYALAWSQSMVYKALALPPSEKKKNKDESVAESQGGAKFG